MNILKFTSPELVSRYFESSKDAEYIVNTLKRNPLSELKDDGALDKFHKVQTINDLIIAEHIERTYEIKGVGLTNLTDIFSPKFTNNFDVWEVRDNLLQRGMPWSQVNQIMEDRIFYLNDFGKGPYKFHQIIRKEVKIDDIKQIDFSTPTLSEYWARVKELVNEAREIKNSLKVGASPIETMKWIINSKNQFNTPVKLQANVVWPARFFSSSINNEAE